MQYTNQTQSHRDGKLDQERTASMADEGGVAGAIMDAHEQARAREARSLATRPRWGGRKLWAVAALGAGAWLVLAGLRKRRPTTRIRNRVAFAANRD